MDSWALTLSRTYSRQLDTHARTRDSSQSQVAEDKFSEKQNQKQVQAVQGNMLTNKQFEQSAMNQDALKTKKEVGKVNIFQRRNRPKEGSVQEIDRKSVV